MQRVNLRKYVVYHVCHATASLGDCCSSAMTVVHLSAIHRGCSRALLRHGLVRHVGLGTDRRAPMGNLKVHLYERLGGR